jgi:transcriptional regulator with XRE-family HTH domain
METNGPEVLIRELGTRVRMARREHGLSQDELARKVGLTRVSINQIENGRRKQIKPEVIRQIATELNMPEGYFYGLQIHSESRPAWPLDHSSPLGSLVPRLLSLPDSQQETVRHILEHLLGLAGS